MQTIDSNETQAHLQYTVVAYRWGWTNNSFYLVGATSALSRAIELADVECECRGGKYGVAVYAWKSDEDYERIHYSPSSYGEDAPETNYRIQMFSDVGHRAHEAATSGQVYMEDPADAAEKQQYLKPFAAAVPAWLDSAVRRAEHQAFWGAKSQADSQAHQKAGLPPLTEIEQKEWFARIEIEATAHVVAVFASRSEAPEMHTDDIAVTLVAPKVSPNLLPRVLVAAEAAAEHAQAEYQRARAYWGDGNPHRWERLKTCAEEFESTFNALQVECDSDRSQKPGPSPESEEIKQLNMQLFAVTADRDHWRSNHDAQVQRARVLHDRPDLPLERVKAYAQIGSLLAERDALCKVVDGMRDRLKDIEDQRFEACRLLAAATAGQSEEHTAA